MYSDGQIACDIDTVCRIECQIGYMICLIAVIFVHPRQLIIMRIDQEEICNQEFCGFVIQNTAFCVIFIERVLWLAIISGTLEYITRFVAKKN